jgi:hypothetical protein
METASDHPAGLPDRHALVIVGMHRSGTSATTGALQCVGVQLGEKLYAGHSDINAKGYFEHSDIADTNEDALLSLGSSWDDILLKGDGWWNSKELLPYAAKIRHYLKRDFSQSPLWALKDPRVCRLLRWWLDIFKEEGISPHFIFVIRSPDEVHKSLERRDGFSREKSFMLWMLHYLEAERESRGYPRAFTLFEEFLENPTSELLRLEQQLGVKYPVPVETAAECLEQFLSKDLRHHKERDSCPATAIAELAYELEIRLRQTAKDGQIITDDIWQRLEEIQAEFPPMLVEQLKSIGAKRGQLERYMHRVERSYSKYAGKPVRFVERLFGRDV